MGCIDTESAFAPIPGHQFILFSRPWAGGKVGGCPWGRLLALKVQPDAGFLPQAENSQMERGKSERFESQH